MAAGNKNLNSAKTARKDEFYTQLTDIEKEMRYYRKHFKDKTVLLLWFCKEIAVLPTVTKQPRMS